MSAANLQTSIRLVQGQTAAGPRVPLLVDAQGRVLLGAGTQVIGAVDIVDVAGNIITPGDAANQAVRVNLVAGAGAGGTALADGAVYTPGATGFTPAGGVYEAAPAALVDGTAGAFRASARRSHIVTLETLAGANPSDEPNSAIRVNVVAGGAGGGVAQTQVRNGAGVWTDVGFAVGNQNMPTSTADGSNVAEGATADAIIAAGAAGSLSAKLRRATQGLEDLKTMIVLAASGNAIGTVGVTSLPADPLGANADAIVAAGAVGSISAKLRRATQGLEDLKTLIVLAAGAAIIGKVGIDQTTPGTTNGVQVNAALPAGANIIGKVGIDQTTPGTTNRVDVGAALPAGANLIGHVDVDAVVGDNADLDSGVGVDSHALVAIGLPNAGGHVVGGTATNPLRTDPTGGTAQPVTDNGGSRTVDQATVSNLNAQVVGELAHDAADSGNPVKIGGNAIADAANPTAVAAGDRVNARFDLEGRQLVRTFHSNFWSAVGDAYATAQTNASLKAAPGAGLSLYITDVIMSNGATAGTMKLIDGSGGATKVGTMYFAITGGAALHFQTPIKLTANTALCLTSVTVTTHSVVVNGFTAP